MSGLYDNFVEVCIFKVKPDKVDEFEHLIERVAKHHREFPGVRDVRYVKRTHRPRDFTSAKKGLPPVRLTKRLGEITYVLYWEMDNEATHGKAKVRSRKFCQGFRKMPRDNTPHDSRAANPIGGRSVSDPRTHLGVKAAESTPTESRLQHLLRHT